MMTSRIQPVAARTIPRLAAFAFRVCALALAAAASNAALHVAVARAQCPEKPPIQHFTGAGRVTCPCFVVGEQAGAVFEAPAGDYPLEILRVGIGWGSQFGGGPQSLEESINIYQAGLPDPGTPFFVLEGPVLNDGAINQFNLEPQPGEIMVQTPSPFTVTLTFANENAGNIFAPSVVHDGNGCQPGKNVVFAQPGTWNDACALGVQGDWLFFVVYRTCAGLVGVGGDTRILSSAAVYLMPPRPNPSRGSTELEFMLAQPGHARLSVHDVQGRRVGLLADGSFTAGLHRATWDGRRVDGGRVPSGVYFVDLVAGGNRTRRSVLIAK